MSIDGAFTPILGQDHPPDDPQMDSAEAKLLQWVNRVVLGEWH